MAEPADDLDAAWSRDPVLNAPFARPRPGVRRRGVRSEPPAALHARRLAGTLDPGEAVYVSFAEVEQNAGRLPRRIVAETCPALDPAGVAWMGADDQPDVELCYRHLVDGTLAGALQKVLDPAALGLVLYDGDPPACPSCVAQAAELAALTAIPPTAAELAVLPPMVGYEPLAADRDTREAQR